MQKESLDNSAGTATGYRPDGRSSIPDRGKHFFFSIASRPALGSTQPVIQWVPGAISPGVKRQEREAIQTSPTSAEAKNCGATPPLLHMPSWCSA
jgi:hypothetical protein